MKIIAVLIIISLLANLASAASYSPNDIEWEAASSATLTKGGTLTKGDYTVKAVQFPSAVPGRQDINGNWLPETDVDPMVYLEIYKKDVLIKELIMTPQTETYIDPDYEAKVYATGFLAKNAKEWVFQFYNPSATIAIETRAKPKIEVKVETDKATYTSYDDQIITAKVTVTNSGGAFAKNLDVSLNTGELKLRGGSTDQLHQYYYKLEKGKNQNFEVILVAPQLIDQKSYSLSADAKGTDVKDIEYQATTGTVTVTVSPRQNFFTLSKAVRNNMYLKDIATVTINIGNGGMYDLYNVHINDSVGENFELQSSTPLQWDIPLLKPGESAEYIYSIRPLEANPDGFKLPAATANATINNRLYNTSSTSPKVVVNGPKLLLNKTVNKAVVNITEDITVTVSVNNVGNIGTKAEVKDSLPEGISLVSGPTSLASTSLEYNKPQGFSYIMRMNTEGEIQLPAVVANYTGIEYGGTTRSVVSSNKTVVTVIDPSKIPPPIPGDVNGSSPGANSSGASTTASQGSTTPSSTTPEPTPDPTITPGFDIAVAAVVVIAAAYTRRRPSANSNFPTTYLL